MKAKTKGLLVRIPSFASIIYGDGGIEEKGVGEKGNCR
jgi:hypothetical protein